MLVYCLMFVYHTNHAFKILMFVNAKWKHFSKAWKLQNFWTIFSFIKMCSVHYNNVLMSPMATQITSLTIVYSTVYSDEDQRKHQSSASLAFVRGIHRWPVNSPHKGPVTRKMFPFDDVIMCAKLSKRVVQYCYVFQRLVKRAFSLVLVLEYRQIQADSLHSAWWIFLPVSAIQDMLIGPEMPLCVRIMYIIIPRHCYIASFMAALYNMYHYVFTKPSNLSYKSHLIPKLKCFSPGVAVVHGSQSRMKM